MKRIKRLGRTLSALRKEYRNSIRLGLDWRSRLRLTVDFTLYHMIHVLPHRMLNTERRITTRSGAKLSYRLNRGDIQSIREVWLDEVYRLPFGTSFGPLLDLGANIGLTTV